MTSIDDLFRKPSLPSNKRKLEAKRNPNEIYKSVKLSHNGAAKDHEHAEYRDKEEDGIARPDIIHEQEGVQEDDEGRFYGAGLTKDTADVLDFLEERGEDAAPERNDSAWLRRLALSFEKKISRNAELRAKFEDTPEKFVGSEADLDTEIKALSVLTGHAELYGEFVKLGCLNSLVSLLAHENTDIAIDAIEIIGELTDEDVEADQMQWDVLVGALLKADLPNLLVQNFDRLDETNEADRNGVYHSLSLMENLASQPSVSEKVVQTSALLKWLLGRVQKKESPTTQNKQYAAEVLAIFLQSSEMTRTLVMKLNAVDNCLQVLSAYRKRDPPKDTEEKEFVENMFDCLTCLVDDKEAKRLFVEAEGVELCLIMLREGNFSKPRALRLLDHALGGVESAAVCEKLVEAAGLKTIFGMFMKSLDHASTEHVLGIFVSLLRYLPPDSAPRIRMLAKFMEKDYHTLGKLVKLRGEYRAKLNPVENLNDNMFCLQTIDVVLAWLVAEDGGARRKISALLERQGEDLLQIKDTLQEQLEGLLLSETSDEAAASADMLRTLVDCMD